MTREEARQIIADWLDWLEECKVAKGRGYIEGWFDEEDVEAFRMAIDALNALPTHREESQRTQGVGSVGWIPCSERLPDEEIDVLVTRTFLGCKDGSLGWNDHIPPTTYVEVAQYFNGEWTAMSDEYKMARSRHTDPVAWMPLPEPYRKTESHEREGE